MGEISADGIIKGKIKCIKTDYFGLVHRENFMGVNRENYIEKLENDCNKSTITEYTITNENDFKKPIDEVFSFENNNEVEKIGDKIYINPLLFYTRTANPFKQEERQYPIDFVFPNKVKYAVSLVIPDGYTVESMPSPLYLKLVDNIAAFSFAITEKGNKVQLVVSEEINHAILPYDMYPSLKEFFQKITDKQNEKIVLKKI